MLLNYGNPHYQVGWITQISLKMVGLPMDQPFGLMIYFLEKKKNLCDEDGESLISKTLTKTLMIVTAVLKMNSIRLKSERMDAVIYKVAECFLMLFLWILSVFFSQNLFLPWFFLQEGLKRTEIGITKASVIYWLAYINISQSGCSFIMFTTTRNMS